MRVYHMLHVQVESISNEFRVFPMEVIAGDSSLETQEPPRIVQLPSSRWMGHP